jgi:tRNA pseudouridine55 synthase
VGHAGTLDPQATGVLVLCVGAATKISSFLMEGTKVYEGSGRLGVETDTQDAEGRVVAQLPAACGPDDVREAAARFIGKIEQVPPMFSAVKVSGRRLYQLARQGIHIERPPRPVTIHSFEIGEVDLPDFHFRVSCSKGAYVRTLVHDLGRALGCGGHLLCLRRVRQGIFDRERCLPWEALQGPGALEAVLRASVPPQEALGFLPEVTLPASAPLRVGALLPRSEHSAAVDGLARVLLAGSGPAGVARVSAEGVRLLYLWPASREYGRGPNR